jgi:hypothetical protein
MKWQEAGEDCNNEDFSNLYSSPNIIMVIKSWGMRRVHVECSGEMKNLRGSNHLEDLGIDGKIISEWILEE